MDSRPRFWADRAHRSDGGKVRFMARSGGYVMCRRPRCAPFVLSEKEWLKLPAFHEADHSAPPTSAIEAPE